MIMMIIMGVIIVTVIIYRSEIRRPLRCRRVRFMPVTPNTTNTHKSLFYEILQQPDTTDTTGSLILPLPRTDTTGTI